MKFQKLSFENPSGQKLVARLDLPTDKQPIAYALFAHCFTCTKNFKAIGNINRVLTGEGIAVLRFDFTGLGESEGDFAETSLSSNVEDLTAAANFLKTEFEAPQLLIGHSLGGAAVLQAATRLPAIMAVVTIAAPCEPVHITCFLGSQKETIATAGEAEVTLAGKTFRLKKQFLDDLERTRMQETIHNLKRALLIFHSPVDNVVGIDNASQIFQTARHPKSFISLDHADHLLSNESDSLYVGAITAVWAKKYLKLPLSPQQVQLINKTQLTDKQQLANKEQ